MLIFLLEAAFRSLLMALAVWAGIRMMRVQAVLAQKVAWVLVLLAAGTMPFVMRAPFLALDRALQIPVRNLQSSLIGHEVAGWFGAQATAKQAVKPAIQVTMPAAQVSTLKIVRPPKPSAAHTLPRTSEPVDSLTLNSGSGTEPTSVLTANSLVVTPNPALEPPLTATCAETESSPWVWSQTISRIRSLAIAVYLLVGGLFLLRVIVGLSVAFRVWRRAATVEDLDLKGAVSQGTGALRVRVSPDLSTPVTIGSTIILPADYEQWDETKLSVVLAHEQSHVRQGDFYLQLIAAVHVAVFWFSPLGWWLQRKLSELGEALSDRAGLEQASSPASYARILLEFAAMPRKNSFASPLTGVAMARASNLSSRIERVLNDRRFRLAFLGGRRHAFIAAILVPAALVAAVGLIRIAPAVEAAQTVKPVKPVEGVAAIGPTTGVVSPQSISTGAPVNSEMTLIAGVGQATAPPAPVVAPTEPKEPSSDMEAPEPPQTPEALEAQDSDAPPAPGHKHGPHILINSGDMDGENFAIVHENGDGTLRWNGEYNDELAKVRNKMKLKGDYIWFERDGKSYVITDPAILAQAQNLFKTDPALEHRMAELELKQAEWQKKMELLEPEMEKATLPGPEFAEKMAKLNAQLAELQSEKFKKMADQMSKQFSQEKLAELQEKVGEIQGQLGEIQGEIGERQGLIGEKQGAIGEEMGKLGEQMGKIGEQEGKNAEEAAKKMKSVLDQAVKNGKATPVQ